MFSFLLFVGSVTSSLSCSGRCIVFVLKFVTVAFSNLGFFLPTFSFTFWKSSWRFLFLVILECWEAGRDQDVEAQQESVRAEPHGMTTWATGLSLSLPERVFKSPCPHVAASLSAAQKSGLPPAPSRRTHVTTARSCAQPERRAVSVFLYCVLNCWVLVI